MHKQKLVVGTRSSQLALWQGGFCDWGAGEKIP